MKAIAVMHPGAGPEFVPDFSIPLANREEEVVVRMKAVAIKHLDKMRASGRHYSTQEAAWTPRVVGSDGVGVMEHGQRVYGMGLNGTMAEQAAFDPAMLVAIPEGLDDTIAAALPNAVMGSAMALRFRAKLQAGSTVLINGATGFTGSIAVQLAKHFGAARVIATGRNKMALQGLNALGADEVISLMEDDQFITGRIQEIHRETPIDIVIDYLWGHPATLILNALKGNGRFTPRTSYISIGSMAGDSILLSSAILRSTDLQLTGSGLGSWTKDEVAVLFKNIMPEVFDLAAQGKLKAAVETCHMEDIEQVWNRDISCGKRLVVLL